MTLSEYDRANTDLTIQLIEKYQEFAFSKANTDVHITASVLITNEKKTHVLLMFHKKLQKWVQFWGHTDGDSDVHGASIREFHEESGILQEPKVWKDIFHIAIHTVPPYRDTPMHIHHDIIFLGTIPFDTPFQRQETEVDDIRWFEIEGIEQHIDETMAKLVSMIR